MNQATAATVSTRFLAIDLHKHYAVIGGINAQQKIVLLPRRVEIDDLETWVQKNLLSSDEVVLVVLSAID